MFFLLLGFWLLLNGRVTLEILITGAVVCGLLWLFLWKFMGYSPKREWAFARRLGWLFRYVLFLVREIFLSSMRVIRLIWSPKLIPEPGVTTFPCPVRTDTGRVVLANSITLTPGTVTVESTKDHMTVQYLDREMAEGLADGEMVTRIRRGEEE